MFKVKIKDKDFQTILNGLEPGFLIEFPTIAGVCKLRKAGRTRQHEQNWEWVDHIGGYEPGVHTLPRPVLNTELCEYITEFSKGKVKFLGVPK